MSIELAVQHFGGNVLVRASEHGLVQRHQGFEMLHAQISPLCIAFVVRTASLVLARIKHRHHTLPQVGETTRRVPIRFFFGFFFFLLTKLLRLRHLWVRLHCCNSRHRPAHFFFPHVWLRVLAFFAAARSRKLFSPRTFCGAPAPRRINVSSNSEKRLRSRFIVLRSRARVYPAMPPFFCVYA